MKAIKETIKFLIWAVAALPMVGATLFGMWYGAGLGNKVWGPSGGVLLAFGVAIVCLGLFLSWCKLFLR